MSLFPQIDKEDVESHPQLGLDQFGGPWKYLTFWNVWVQAIYFLMCYVNDKRGREKRKNTEKLHFIWNCFSNLLISDTKLKKAEDYLYATLAFPVGMFVGIVFWTLFAIDRELVNKDKSWHVSLQYYNFFRRFSPPCWTSTSPLTWTTSCTPGEEFKKIIPTAATHNFDFVFSVIPLQLFELLFVRHQYPKSLAKGALVTVALCFTYCVWIQVIKKTLFSLQIPLSNVDWYRDFI